MASFRRPACRPIAGIFAELRLMRFRARRITATPESTKGEDHAMIVSPDATCSRPRPRWPPRAFASPLRAAPPAASAITPALVEAAKKEGKVAFYTAMDLPFARAARQGLRGEVSRASPCASSAPAPSASSPASPRNMRSNIHAVDVVNTADQAHCIVWKRNGWLAPYLPEEVAKHYRHAATTTRRPRT